MKSKINLAYVLTPIEFGGAEKVSLNFLRSIDRNEFRVFPILLIRPWEDDNILMQKLKDEKHEHFKIPVAVRPSHQGRDYFRVIRCFRMLYSILSRGDFNLIHTNGYFADIIGIPAARILGIPHIATCHGFISTDKKLNLYNTSDRLVLRFSDRILAVSDSIKYDLMKTGIKASHITVIQNAVEGNPDEQLFIQRRQQKRRSLNVMEGESVVGYVGRLTEEKGLQYLIQAVAILRESNTRLCLLVIGDGPQKHELAKLVRHTGLQNTVVFAGFQKDVRNWLPAMDIFVLPSLTEGTPMSLLEAMACGIPPIATAVGGVPQIIDSGLNGLLVSPAEPEEIAKAIRLLLGNKKLFNRLSESAKQTIKSRFSIGNWIRQIECAYKEVIAQ